MQKETLEKLFHDSRGFVTCCHLHISNHNLGTVIFTEVHTWSYWNKLLDFIDELKAVVDDQLRGLAFPGPWIALINVKYHVSLPGNEKCLLGKVKTQQQTVILCQLTPSH